MKTLDELSRSSPARPGSGVSVLVVDDEDAVRRFASRVLARDGFTVIEAQDGAEALAHFQHDGRPAADIVVSDIVMPRLNGVELMGEISLSHPGTPVILMSGYANAALSEMGIATPCGIITKPFSAERLLAEVHRCVSHRGGGSSAA